MFKELTISLFNHLGSVARYRVLCLSDANFTKLFRRLRFRFESLLLGRDMCENY